MRALTRSILIIAFIGTLAITTVVFWINGADKPEIFMVCVASLAVIAAVISAWTSLRVVELQEDRMRPNPYPVFDLKSRSELALIKVINSGESVAHNISLEWDVELKNSEGKKIGFLRAENKPGISILMPGESISQIISVTTKFLNLHPDCEYSGKISFEDSSGKKYEVQFRLDGRHYRGTPVHETDESVSHRELQRIPKELSGLTKEVKLIRQAIKQTPSSEES